MIEVKNLSKLIDGVKILKNISLSINEGDIYGVLGVNGAGKTTLLRVIGGISKCCEGEIIINGNEFKYGKKASVSMSYMQDVPSMYEWMNGYEFLHYIGELYGINSVELQGRIDECLKMVSLYDNRKKRIRTYSRGMKQRLGIAYSFLSYPKVIILDEPLSALDFVGRKDLIKIISKMREKSTIIFSSHQLEDIESLCNRVLIINNGEKVQEEEVSKLKDDIKENIVVVELCNECDDEIVLELVKNISGYIHGAMASPREIHLYISKEVDNPLKEVMNFFGGLELNIRGVFIKELTLEDIFKREIYKG
ncbi:MAG: ABC transporter ATP-binding protein [Clostridium sp.]